MTTSANDPRWKINIHSYSIDERETHSISAEIIENYQQSRAQKKVK